MIGLLCDQGRSLCAAGLDREGAAGPGDVAIVGSESSVERQLAEIEEAGGTELNVMVFGSADDQQRTFEFLRTRVAHGRSAAV